MTSSRKVSRAPEGRKNQSLRQFHIASHMRHPMKNALAPLPLAVISFAPCGARGGRGADFPTAGAVGYILSALPGLNWATIIRVFWLGGSRTAPTRRSEIADPALLFPTGRILARKIRHNLPILSQSAGIPLGPGRQRARLQLESRIRVEWRSKERCQVLGAMYYCSMPEILVLVAPTFRSALKFSGAKNRRSP